MYHRRYLNSRFGLIADLDVRGAAFTAMAKAMELTPPATLPLDPESQAWHLRIPVETWRELLSRKINPLDGWVEIHCGDKVRMTHPILLEGLEVAVKAAKLRQRGTTERQRGEPPDAGRAPR